MVEVCTNFVHREVEGLSGYALGGRSYTSRFVQPDKNIFVMLSRTSMIYGDAGLKYGTYVELGRDFRSYNTYRSAVHVARQVENSPETIVLEVLRSPLFSSA